MPKIATINPNTGSKIGDAQFQGRTVKVKTNANPTYLNSFEEKELPQAERKDHPPTSEGQVPKGEDNTEVKALDPHHEALAKKESAIRARERDLQAKEAALEAKIKSEIEEALKQYRAKLKSSPLDVLNEEGLTYDQLVEQAVQQADPNYQTTRSMQQKLETIEANQKRFEEESKKSADSQREAAVRQITYDVQELIEADPSFETIKATGSIQDVVDLITKQFDETGKLLSIDQAAKLVEDELFEEAIKIASLTKVKDKLKPQLSPELVNNAKQQPIQQVTTLTNQMTSKRPMTARERAIARFKGENF